MPSCKLMISMVNDIEELFSGSRITTIFNFGYVSLNILHLRAEDAGSYTVRAVNRLGEAVSSASLRVLGKHNHTYSSEIIFNFLDN